MRKVVFLTGATGFLGSQIANVLVHNEIEVVALKRKNSDCYRCDLFNNKINWVDIDSEESWKEKVIDLMPTHIIHCAWIGVEVCERDDVKIQSQNISFLADLLEVSKLINLSQFISLGSQAEYGLLNDKVSEKSIVNPSSAYGVMKVASQQVLETFCNSNQIKWIWLRLFSFIGENENNNWLIPSLIKKIVKGEVMDMTLGEQKYSYMFVNDFAIIILKIINSNIQSGIYNVSGDEIISLKELVDLIGEKLTVSPKINWGALTYRINQSMHIEGDTSALKNQIGNYKLTSISDTIDKVLVHYKNQ